MNREEPFREQAERLKQRIENINSSIEPKEISYSVEPDEPLKLFDDVGSDEHISLIESDKPINSIEASASVEDSEHLGNLPPRERRHKQKKHKVKWKIKYPVIRLIALSFILLPVIIFSVISSRNEHEISQTAKTVGNNAGYETVNLEDPQKGETKKQAEQQEQPAANQETNDANDSDSETGQPQTGIEPQNNNSDTGEAVQPPGATDTKIGSGTSTTDKNSQPQQESAKTKQTAAQPTQRIVYHTVQSKETLYGIAMKYYHSQGGMEIIRKANHIEGDQIDAGQVLKIPLEK